MKGNITICLDTTIIDYLNTLKKIGIPSSQLINALIIQYYNKHKQTVDYNIKDNMKYYDNAKEINTQ